MELRHLRYFVALCESLHFGQAAAKLGIAQPSLTHQIQQLEAELETTLLRRTKRRVELTEAGRILLEEAREILARSDRAALLTRRASRGGVGTLRVAVGYFLDHVDLGKVVSRFNQQYEGVSVDVRTIGVPAQLAAIRDGDLDIGFVRPPVTDPSLRSEVLLREPLVVALPAKHRLAAKDPVPLSALAAESFVLPARTVAPVYYHLVLRVCREAGFVPHSTHEADNLPLMLGMVASGGEVALVHLSGRKFGVGGVTFTSLRPPPPPLETAIAWRAENSSPAIEGFVKTARDLLGGPRNRPGRKA